MERKTFEQALNEALTSAKVSYAENRDLHTIHNGLIHCNQSYVDKQVKISRQLLDRLNEIDRQYNLTYEQQDEINYHISYAWQDVLMCQGEWDRMYCALCRINHEKIQNEHKRRLEEQRRRQEDQQIQIRRIRRGKNLTKRHKMRDRFMEEFSQISPEQWQAILRRADNQKADDKANFQ